MLTFKKYFYQTESTKPLAPAYYVGIQNADEPSAFEIFNLTQDITDHTEGSTVSRNTLEELGYLVPIIPPNTPRGTKLEALLPKTEAQQTKSNPFGYKRHGPLTPVKSHLPKKTFKRQMKEKPHKRDLLKPRQYHVNSFGRLIKKFT